MVTASTVRENHPRLRTGGLLARDNPFRVERVHAFRYRPQRISWEAIIENLQQLRMRGAIVGPEGTGKTTLLEDLEQRLIAEGHVTRWLRMRRDTRSAACSLVRETLRRSKRHEILLVDGAEQIGSMTWRRFAARARKQAGLIVTVHSPGRLPTIVECTTTPALLEEMVRDLAPEWFDLLAPELPRLFERHAGNLRLCIRELYDWLAG